MPARIEAIHNAAKTCAECGVPVKIKSVRDITRKNFCSRACSNRSSLRARIAGMAPCVCGRCGATYKATANTQKFCSHECLVKGQVERSYAYLNDNPRGYIKHLICKPGRKHITIEFMLDLLRAQHGKCALSGVAMTFVKRTDGVKQHTNLSIDRIDSSLGYDLSNIQLVCAVVNIMKTTLSVAELHVWCERILNT